MSHLHECSVYCPPECNLAAELAAELENEQAEIDAAMQRHPAGKGLVRQPWMVFDPAPVGYDNVRALLN